MVAYSLMLGSRLLPGPFPSLGTLIFCRSNQYYTHSSHRVPVSICQQFLHTTNRKHVTSSKVFTSIKHRISPKESGNFLKNSPWQRIFYCTKTVQTTLKKAPDTSTKQTLKLMPGGEFKKVFSLAKPESLRITGMY